MEKTRKFVHVKINHVTTSLQLVTGSNITIINADTWEKKIGKQRK